MDSLLEAFSQATMRSLRLETTHLRIARASDRVNEPLRHLPPFIETVAVLWPDWMIWR